MLLRFMQRKNDTKFRVVASSEIGQWRLGETPRTFKGVSDGLTDNVGSWNHDGENEIIS